MAWCLLFLTINPFPRVSFSQDIQFIRANFDIERFMYFSHQQREEHGRLSHILLNPVFQHHAKYILKEVLRLAQKSCLYFLLHPPHYSHKVGKRFFSCKKYHSNLTRVSFRAEVSQMGVRVLMKSY